MFRTLQRAVNICRKTAWSGISLLALCVVVSIRAESQEPWFEEISEHRSGLDFRFESGTRRQFDLPEIMAGGMAAADFDGDGRLDLFFCQGGPMLAEIGQGAGNRKVASPSDPPCVWYRNLGGMKFRRVACDVTGPSYAMGAWPADFDADGRPDLFVSGWRGWALYRNLGDWKFDDVTASLGADVPAWSTAAVWCDFDMDGHQDLFVGGYVDFDIRQAPYCAAPDGKRDYCGPEDFRAVPNRLFHGDGQGAFEDVSDRLGESRKSGRTLGAIASDIDADGRIDLIVANDGSACELLMQQADGTYRDEAIPRGVAFDAEGAAIAAMGVAFADVAGRGTSELVVTNFYDRGTVVFESTKPGHFLDTSGPSGLKAATRRFNGFGVAAADFDGDGKTEIVQANGHVLSRERLGIPLRMPPVLLKRNSGGRFEAIDESRFPIADHKMIGRGLIVADFDSDGRPDLLISRLDGPPVLLRNVSKAGSPAARFQKPMSFGGSYLSGLSAPASREAGH